MTPHTKTKPNHITHHSTLQRTISKTQNGRSPQFHDQKRHTYRTHQRNMVKTHPRTRSHWFFNHKNRQKRQQSRDEWKKQGWGSLYHYQQHSPFRTHPHLSASGSDSNQNSLHHTKQWANHSNQLLQST